MSWHDQVLKAIHIGQLHQWASLDIQRRTGRNLNHKLLISVILFPFDMIDWHVISLEMFVIESQLQTCNIIFHRLLYLNRYSFADTLRFPFQIEFPEIKFHKKCPSMS